MTPTIDIIIPTFQRPAMTMRALTSVRAQTYTDWRALVIDDASGDGSADTLRSLTADDERVHVVERLERGGPQGARQTGFEVSSAPWVALMDSDDEWMPTKLERQIAITEGYDVVLCWHRWEGDDGWRGPIGTPMVDGPLPPLLSDNMSTPLIRRAFLNEIGGMLPPTGRSLRGSEGIEFYVRMSTRALATVVPEFLTTCRRHGTQAESDILQTLGAADDLASVLELHAEHLAAHPEARAALRARVGARYIAAGRRRPGRAFIRQAFRHVGMRTRVALARRYVPYLLRTALQPVGD